MTNQPPPNPQSSSDDELGFDDFIGILVAFLTIGTVLFWSLTRKDSNCIFGIMLSKASGADKVAAKSDKDNNFNNLTALLVPSPEPNNNVKYSQPAVKAEPKQDNQNPTLLEKETFDAIIPPFLAPPVGKLPPEYEKVTGNNSINAGLNVGDGKYKPIETPVVVDKPTPTPTQTPTPTPTLTLTLTVHYLCWGGDGGENACDPKQFREPPLITLKLFQDHPSRLNGKFQGPPR